jgi:hypothetical protein
LGSDYRLRFVIEFTRTGFYAGTGSIGIRHPEFVARYAEINPAKGLWEGTLVQQGQILPAALQSRSRTPEILHSPGCYWLLGVAVGDGVAAGAGNALKVSIRSFQVSPSRTQIDDQ